MDREDNSSTSKLSMHTDHYSSEAPSSSSALSPVMRHSKASDIATTNYTIDIDDTISDSDSTTDVKIVQVVTCNNSEESSNLSRRNESSSSEYVTKSSVNTSATGCGNRVKIIRNVSVFDVGDSSDEEVLLSPTSDMEEQFKFSNLKTVKVICSTSVALEDNYLDSSNLHDGSPSVNNASRSVTTSFAQSIVTGNKEKNIKLSSICENKLDTDMDTKFESNSNISSIRMEPSLENNSKRTELTKSIHSNVSRTPCRKSKRTLSTEKENSDTVERFDDKKISTLDVQDLNKSEQIYGPTSSQRSNEKVMCNFTISDNADSSRRKNNITNNFEENNDSAEARDFSNNQASVGLSPRICKDNKRSTKNYSSLVNEVQGINLNYSFISDASDQNITSTVYDESDPLIVECNKSVNYSKNYTQSKLISYDLESVVNECNQNVSSKIKNDEQTEISYENVEPNYEIMVDKDAGKRKSERIQHTNQLNRSLPEIVIITDEDLEQNEDEVESIDENREGTEGVVELCCSHSSASLLDQSGVLTTEFKSAESSHKKCKQYSENTSQSSEGFEFVSALTSRTPSSTVEEMQNDLQCIKPPVNYVIDTNTNILHPGKLSLNDNTKCLNISESITEQLGEIPDTKTVNMLIDAEASDGSLKKMMFTCTSERKSKRIRQRSKRLNCVCCSICQHNVTHTDKKSGQTLHVKNIGSNIKEDQGESCQIDANILDRNNSWHDSASTSSHTSLITSMDQPATTENGTHYSDSNNTEKLDWNRKSSESSEFASALVSQESSPVMNKPDKEKLSNPQSTKLPLNNTIDAKSLTFSDNIDSVNTLRDIQGNRSINMDSELLTNTDVKAHEKSVEKTILTYIRENERISQHSAININDAADTGDSESNVNVISDVENVPSKVNVSREGEQVDISCFDLCSSNLAASVSGHPLSSSSPSLSTRFLIAPDKSINRADNTFYYSDSNETEECYVSSGFSTDKSVEILGMLKGHSADTNTGVEHCATDSTDCLESIKHIDSALSKTNLILNYSINKDPLEDTYENNDNNILPTNFKGSTEINKELFTPNANIQKSDRVSSFSTESDYTLALESQESSFKSALTNIGRETDICSLASYKDCTVQVNKANSNKTNCNEIPTIQCSDFSEPMDISYGTPNKFSCYRDTNILLVDDVKFDEPSSPLLIDSPINDNLKSPSRSKIPIIKPIYCENKTRSVFLRPAVFNFNVKNTTNINTSEKLLKTPVKTPNLENNAVNSNTRQVSNIPKYTPSRCNVLTTPRSDKSSTTTCSQKKKVLYDNIKSPIRAYIQTSSPVLVTKVRSDVKNYSGVKSKTQTVSSEKKRGGTSQIPTNHNTVERKLVYENETEIARDDAAENFDPNIGRISLAPVNYSPASKVFLKENQDSPKKLPKLNKTLQKLLGTPKPKVTKHEGRVNVAPSEPGTLITHHDHDDSVTSLSNAEGDISIYASKTLFKTNTSSK